VEAAQVAVAVGHPRHLVVVVQAADLVEEGHLLRQVVVASLQASKQPAEADHPHRQVVVGSLQANKQQAVAVAVGNKGRGKILAHKAAAVLAVTKPLETRTTLVSLVQKAEALVVVKETLIRAGRKKARTRVVTETRRNPTSLRKTKAAKTRKKRVAERRLQVQLVRLQEPISEVRSVVRLGNVSENLYTEFLLYSYSLLSV
jgi:hypothetical protein